MNKIDKYKKYEATVEEFAKRYSRDKFAYLEEDDLMQEIRNICFNALEKFDEAKSSIKTYLHRCITNRLNNLKRDIFFRLENPCKTKKCSMYNIFTEDCTSEEVKQNCPILAKVTQKMVDRINIINAVPIGDTNIDMSENYHDMTHLETVDLNMKIRSELINESGAYFGITYDKMIFYGDSHVTDDFVDFVRGKAREIIYG